MNCKAFLQNSTKTDCHAFYICLFLYEIQSELSHTLACPPLLKCRGVGYLRKPYYGSHDSDPMLPSNANVA